MDVTRSHRETARSLGISACAVASVVTRTNATGLTWVTVGGLADHMPQAHRAHLEWSPSRLIGWGASIGRHTEALVQALLESRPHPEQGYLSCWTSSG